MSIAPSARGWGLRQLGRLGRGSVVLVPLALLLLLVLYPLASIIIQSVIPGLFALHPDLAPTLDGLVAVLSQPSSYTALGSTLLLGAVTGLGSAVIGSVLALLVQRTDMPLRRATGFAMWIIFFTPSFLLGEAWSIVLARGGTFDRIVHLPQGFIDAFFSPLGVALLLTLKGIPFVYFSVSVALRWLGGEYEDAARISGARWHQAWARINLPLLAPAIFAGALIVFAESISDFGTAVTIAQNAHVNLVTYEIYQAINTFPVDFQTAAGESLLLFVAIVVPLAVQARVLGRGSFQTITGRVRPSHRMSLGHWRWPAFAGTAVVLAVALVIPVLECLLLSVQHSFGNGFGSANFTLGNYRAVLTAGGEDVASLGTSFRLAVTAATVVTVTALPIAYVIARTRLPGRRVLGFMTLATISVPGIILAAGYIFGWNSPYLQNVGIGGPHQIHVYGTIWILLGAYIGAALPYAIRLTMGHLHQVGDSLLDAARVHGAGFSRVLTAVVVPMLRSSMASIWILVFTGSIFELAASELLYPPGNPTMPVRIQLYFGNFRIEQGMALAMLNVAVVVLFVAVIRLLGLAWTVASRTLNRRAG